MAVAASAEGGTPLLLPSSPGERGPARRSDTFYNAAMALDRDLTVAVATSLAEEGRRGRGWEMLAATGVRGLRVLNESRLLDALLLTDWNRAALPTLEANAASLAGRGAIARRHDARTVPEGGERSFGWIDLDPFGSPRPFLGALFAAAAPGAVVGITATDMQVLAGSQRAACRRHYGARSVPGRLGPEAGLRILLALVDREATAAGRRWSPLVSYVRDHYVRTFLRLDADTPPHRRVETLDPATFDGPRLPPGGPYGPLWTGPLGTPGFVGRLVTPTTAARADLCERFLTLLRGEAAIPAPFYYEANLLASEIGLARPPKVERLLEVIRSAGFRAERTHAREGAWRTDAPGAEVRRLARGLTGAGAQSQKARVFA